MFEMQLFVSEVKPVTFLPHYVEFVAGGALFLFMGTSMHTEQFLGCVEFLADGALIYFLIGFGVFLCLVIFTF